MSFILFCCSRRLNNYALMLSNIIYSILNISNTVLVVVFYLLIERHSSNTMQLIKNSGQLRSHSHSYSRALFAQTQAIK